MRTACPRPGRSDMSRAGTGSYTSTMVRDMARSFPSAGVNLEEYVYLMLALDVVEERQALHFGLHVLRRIRGISALVSMWRGGIIASWSSSRGTKACMSAGGCQ